MKESALLCSWTRFSNQEMCTSSHHRRGQPVAGHPAGAADPEAPRSCRKPASKITWGWSWPKRLRLNLHSVTCRGRRSSRPRKLRLWGPRGSCNNEVNDTQEKVTILQTHFPPDRDEVLANLLAVVCDIRPKIDGNHRLSGQEQKKEAPVPWVGTSDASRE